MFHPAFNLPPPPLTPPTLPLSLTNTREHTHIWASMQLRCVRVDVAGLSWERGRPSSKVERDATALGHASQFLNACACGRRLCRAAEQRNERAHKCIHYTYMYICIYMCMCILCVYVHVYVRNMCICRGKRGNTGWRAKTIFSNHFSILL